MLYTSVKLKLSIEKPDYLSQKFQQSFNELIAQNLKTYTNH